MKDTQHYKTKLEQEKKLLEGELKSIGYVNPKNSADSEAHPDKIDTISADRNEVADKLESYESNTAIFGQLDAQLNDVIRALDKIEAGTYGLCESCNEPIPEDRLEANPSARTCVNHSV